MDDADEQELEDELQAMVDGVVDALIADEEYLLDRERAGTTAFVARHRGKWAKSLRLTELFLHSFSELGQTINQEERPAAAAGNDYRFDAIIRNHARIVQVGREVLVLAENGYASGAVARWRTMHEIAVVTLFLDKHGQDISERYLAYDWVESKRSAARHKESEARLKCDAPTDEEMAELTNIVDQLVARFGDEFKETNGWASPCFPKNNKKKRRITFESIEKDVALDHWRARYLIASQFTHATAKAAYWNLSAGRMDHFLLCGPADSGLGYALHPLFLSCNIVARCLVNNWPGEGEVRERLVTALVLVELERRAAVALVEEEGEQDPPSQST